MIGRIADLLAAELSGPSVERQMHPIAPSHRCGAVARGTPRTLSVGGTPASFHDFDFEKTYGPLARALGEGRPPLLRNLWVDDLSMRPDRQGQGGVASARNLRDLLQQPAETTHEPQ